MFRFPHGAASRINFKVCLAGLAAIALLGLLLAGIYWADRPKASARTTSIATNPVDSAARDAPPDAPMPLDLYRFALNAFLVPLMDDNVPPSWSNVAMDFECESGTSVMIDGAPMVPGRPIPSKTFTVRWSMDHCAPMGREALQLTGGVELIVSHQDRDFHAIVTPDRLRVDSHMGRAWLRGPFSADTQIETVAGSH